jgi:hypothetical protein
MHCINARIGGPARLASPTTLPIGPLLSPLFALSFSLTGPAPPTCLCICLVSTSCLPDNPLLLQYNTLSVPHCCPWQPKHRCPRHCISWCAAPCPGIRPRPRPSCVACCSLPAASFIFHLFQSSNVCFCRPMLASCRSVTFSPDSLIWHVSPTHVSHPQHSHRAPWHLLCLMCHAPPKPQRPSVN